MSVRFRFSAFRLGLVNYRWGVMLRLPGRRWFVVGMRERMFDWEIDPREGNLPIDDW